MPALSNGCLYTNMDIWLDFSTEDSRVYIYVNFLSKDELPFCCDFLLFIKFPPEFTFELNKLGGKISRLNTNTSC